MTRMYVTCVCVLLMALQRTMEGDEGEGEVFTFQEGMTTHELSELLYSKGIPHQYCKIFEGT